MHDKWNVFLEIQGWLNISKSINVICHIKSLKVQTIQFPLYVQEKCSIILNVIKTLEK